MTRRTERIEDLLRAEISELILRQINDPRITMTTVAEVKVSPDLRHARVQVSVLGPEEDRRATISALKHAGGFIRSKLATRLRLRAVPHLEFELYRGAEYSQRITDLLEKLDDGDHSS